MSAVKTIFLIGYMGSGKTTLGKKLASRLGVPFNDLDGLIVANTGLSIPDFFAKYGEDAFRQKESEVLQRIDTSITQVVAVGGGTPCFSNNMEWMNTYGKTIYLQMAARALWSRLNQSDVTKRPVLQGLTGQDLLAFVSEKLEQREPFYLQAHYVINQMHTSIDRMVDECMLVG